MIKEASIKVIDMVAPKNKKISAWAIVNMIGLMAALLGYILPYTFLKIAGILYTLGCGIAMFAGLNNYDG